MSDTYLKDLLTGVKDHLGRNDIAASIGPLTASPVKGSVPAVGLMAYPLQDDLGTGNILTGVQVRIRGNAFDGPGVVWDLQGKLFRLLTSHSWFAIPGAVVVTCWRQSSTPLVPDASNRPEVFDSYYVRSDRLGLTP